MDTKIYGVWENSELKYYLNNDGSLKIFWKKKQAECTGLYNLSEDMIFFRYGKNHSIKWSGLIEVLDDNFLQIRDLSNEIGKIDSFKKTPITYNEIFNLKAIQSEIIIGNINSYPQIHLPIEIIKNFDKIFPPPTKPTHPIEPIKPSKKDTLFVFFLGTIIALILLYFNQFIFGFIIICLLIYILFSNLEQKDYIEKLKKYNFDLTSFYKSLKEYEDELKIIDQQSYQTYKRNKAKYNIINNSAKHLINIDYKKGISHDYFELSIEVLSIIESPNV